MTISGANAQAVAATPPRAQADAEVPPPPPENELDEDLLRLQQMEQDCEAAEAALAAARADDREPRDALSQLKHDVAHICAFFQSLKAPGTDALIRSAMELSQKPSLTPKEVTRIKHQVITECLRLYQPGSPGESTLATHLLSMGVGPRQPPVAGKFELQLAYRALVKAAAFELHRAATGGQYIYTTWDRNDGPEHEGTPARAASQIDLLGCVRAAKFLHLDQSSPIPYPKTLPIVYGEGWSAKYREQIPRMVDVQRLTQAEILRLSEPGAKPEWNWLPGLQEAAENAVAASCKRHVADHLPQADLPRYENRDIVADITAQYMQPQSRGLKDEGWA